MARKLTAFLVTAAIWAVVALVALFIAAKGGEPLDLKLGYVLVAATVFGGWVATEFALTGLRLDRPYQPD